MARCTWCEKRPRAHGHKSYCRQCLYVINELNQVVRAGPTNVKVTYPYTPAQKLVYSLTTEADRGCTSFEGSPTLTGQRSLPIDMTFGLPLGTPGKFTDTIFGCDYTVYFVLDAKRWRVKIGRTQMGIHERLSALVSLENLGSSWELLGCLFRRGRPVENALHKRFKQASLGGEWFSPAEDLMRFICKEA